MPEKEEEGANKALEVIPLFFFDLIARVVPGLFLLLGANLICDWKPLTEAIEYSVREKILDSTFTLLAVALLGGYVTGHLISPFVKALDNWYKNANSDREIKSTSSFLSKCCRRLGPPRSSPRNAYDAQKQPDHGEMYDQLRLLCPGVTNITMRIRAEYIMYGGFCFALLVQFFMFLWISLEHLFEGGLDSLLRTFHLADCILSGFKAAALLAGAILMFYRNQETIGTFNRTVQHFYDAAKRAGRFQECPSGLAQNKA